MKIQKLAIHSGTQTNFRRWNVASQADELDIARDILESQAWLFYPKEYTEERINQIPYEFNPELVKPEALKKVPKALQLYIRLPPTHAMFNVNSVSKNRVSNLDSIKEVNEVEQGKSSQITHKVSTKPFESETDEVQNKPSEVQKAQTVTFSCQDIRKNVVDTGSIRQQKKKKEAEQAKIPEQSVVNAMFDQQNEQQTEELEQKELEEDEYVSLDLVARKKTQQVTPVLLRGYFLAFPKEI